MAPYINLKVPSEVADRIDAYLARDGTYRSRAEITKTATLAWLDAAEARLDAKASAKAAPEARA
ncbi:MAG: hypothetical protein ACYDDF_05180 [Thermoplasmatota archaeon]